MHDILQWPLRAGRLLQAHARLIATVGRKYPMVYIAPAAVFALLCSLGCWAVVQVMTCFAAAKLALCPCCKTALLH
jgi:hypothetical protein